MSLLSADVWFKCPKESKLNKGTMNTLCSNVMYKKKL